MIRVLNFFCVALMGLSILALYDVSEKTRLARVDIGKTERAISDERGQMSVLETDWAPTCDAGPHRDAGAQQARPRQHRRGAALPRSSSCRATARTARSATITSLRNANAEAPAQ